MYWLIEEAERDKQTDRQVRWAQITEHFNERFLDENVRSRRRRDGTSYKIGELYTAYETTAYHPR